MAFCFTTKIQKKIPSGQQSSRILLQQHRRLSNPQVFLSGHETPDGFLHHYAAPHQLLESQLFQISHLAGSKKYICFPELVHVWVLNILFQDVFAGFFHVIPVDVFEFA